MNFGSKSTDRTIPACSCNFDCIYTRTSLRISCVSRASNCREGGPAMMNGVVHDGFGGVYRCFRCWQY